MEPTPEVENNQKEKIQKEDDPYLKEYLDFRKKYLKQNNF